MIKEEGPVINGVRMDDITLNSSRSRRRKDSQGSPKHQRKSTPTENGGTDEIRRVSSAAYARDVSKGQDREPSVTLRKKGRDDDRLSAETKDKRGSSIVLDVNSILDELVSAGDDGLELPETSTRSSTGKLGTERKSAPRSTPSPILRVESADPPQPKKGNALETTVTRSSRLIRSGTDERNKDLSKTTTTTTGSSVSTSSSYTTDKRPPVSPARSPARVRGSESTGTANTVSSPVEEKSMQPSPQSPDLKEAETKDGQKSSSSSRRIYSSRTSKALQNENEEEESSSYRSRTRSNAISKADAQQYSPKVSAKNEKNEKIEEEEPPASPRLRDKSKRRSHIDSVVEMRPQRSASWNRMRQLVNSKQLGMFYHNRRSQAFDHDSQDEDSRVSDRGSSLERSDSSTSTPHSPTVVSPRSRESRGFSPLSVKSPLALKHRGFDEAHTSLLEKKEREESGHGSVPATPSTPSSATQSTLAPPREQDEEEPQVWTHSYYMP